MNALTALEDTLRTIFGDCNVNEDVEGGYVHITVHHYHAALRVDSETHDGEEHYGYLIGSFDVRGKWHAYSPELWTNMACVTSVVAELIAGSMALTILNASGRTNHTSNYAEVA